MSFSIRLLRQDGQSSAARGRIQIGTFEEAFEADLSHWTRARYEQQWREALLRIVSGEPTSCLITSLTDPATANFIFWWPMYSSGDEVVFQNQVLFLEQVNGPFNPANPYVHVAPRMTVAAEGAPLSEWRISKQHLARFLEGGSASD